MKKYKVTEWGVLLDFDITEESTPIVRSNVPAGYEVLSFKYNQSELYDSEVEAWLEFYNQKVYSLKLEKKI